MKYYSRANMYKASNVRFDCETETAYSYDWWQFVKIINGKRIFNNYNYSPTTIKHQYKMRQLLDELGMKIDVTVECPDGLQSLESGIEYYKSEIDTIERKIAQPRTRKKTNEDRAELIEEYRVKIELLKELQK